LVNEVGNEIRFTPGKEVRKGIRIADAPGKDYHIQFLEEIFIDIVFREYSDIVTRECMDNSFTAVHGRFWMMLK
jgi:hypothetical protein